MFYQAFGVLTGNKTLSSTVRARDVALKNGLSEKQWLISLVSSIGSGKAAPLVVVVLNGSGQLGRLKENLDKCNRICEERILYEFEQCMTEVATRLSVRHRMDQY